MSKDQSISAKNHNLFIILSALFITNALMAEFIGVKIISLEKILGLQPLNIDFLVIHC
jgi:queuosine precursor transporter